MNWLAQRCRTQRITKPCAAAGPATGRADARSGLARVAGGVAGATLLALAVPAGAQPRGDEAWPARPVRLVAAAAPGGGIDIIARFVAQRLADAWKQPVVVDNRAGSGGLIATETVVRALPDGHTLLAQSVGVAYVGTLHRNAPFDVLRDLAPITLIASQPSLLGTHPSQPWTTLSELLQFAKARPDLVTYGSGGVGGASHMGTELFAQAAGLRLVHVPFKGTGPSMTALLAGEIQLALVGVATAAAHVRAGKIRVLGITSAQRSPLMPDVPTLAEAGVPGYEFAGWYALFAPAKTPRAVIERVNRDANRLLGLPEARQQLAAMGFEPLGGPVDAFRDYFAAEVRKWRKVIEAGKISAQ
jgi:tripartite-type tricarboxylate transporter receptor subunit TctC